MSDRQRLTAKSLSETCDLCLLTAQIRSCLSRTDEYRFLIDNDNPAASKLFPGEARRHTRSGQTFPCCLRCGGCRASPKLGCIIVTANGADFEKEIKLFLQKLQRKGCYDLFGLVVIPNTAAIQERVLPGISAKLRFDGKPISWGDVWRQNYLVRIHSDGSVEVRELGRCFYCKKLQSE